MARNIDSSTQVGSGRKSCDNERLIFLDERELVEASVLGDVRTAQWAGLDAPTIVTVTDPAALSRAEFAAAKYLRLPQPSALDGPHMWLHPKGTLQVRTTKVRGGGLILFADDPDDHIYVLVEEDAPAGPYRICGWTPGRMAKTPQYQIPGELAQALSRFEGR